MLLGQRDSVRPALGTLQTSLQADRSNRVDGAPAVYYRTNQQQQKDVSVLLGLDQVGCDWLRERQEAAIESIRRRGCFLPETTRLQAARNRKTRQAETPGTPRCVHGQDWIQAGIRNHLDQLSPKHSDVRIRAWFSSYTKTCRTI